ncbi:MAG TPA: hypothetical protein VFE62_26615 [Gemmataceae bacterium]|nr:hypothetical protein [Gemmataceae bacterium]
MANRLSEHFAEEQTRAGAGAWMELYAKGDKAVVAAIDAIAKALATPEAKARAEAVYNQIEAGRHLLRAYKLQRLRPNPERHN